MKPVVEHTLNPYMDVILRLFSLAGVFVSFGEGVCGTWSVSLSPDGNLSPTVATTTEIERLETQDGQ